MNEDMEAVINEIAEDVKSLPEESRDKLLCVLQGVSIGLNVGKEARK